MKSQNDVQMYAKKTKDNLSPEQGILQDGGAIAGKPSAHEVVERIAGEAAKKFRFRGGRIPAMTLCEKSCIFYPIESRDVSAWLTEAILETGLLPRSDMKQIIVDILTAHALKASQEEPAHRIFQGKHALYYKISNNSIVRISKKGVIMNSFFPGVSFWRSSLEADQCLPDFSSSHKELLPLLKQAFHIKKDYRYAFAAALLGFFVPKLQTPILVLSGEKGTAKTTTSKHILELVNPSIAQAVTALPNGRDALITQLSNSYIAAFDNVAFPLKADTSNLLCLVATHAAISKRSLYSTNLQAVYDLKTKIVCNGIDEIAAKADLAERCCVIYLNQIPDADRRCYSEVEAEFNELKPRILGSIFNSLVEVFKDTTDFSDVAKPRMADFADFGLHVIHVLGEKPEKFLQQYTSGIKEQLSDAEARSPIVLAVDRLLFGRQGYLLRETPTVMAKMLNAVAKRNKIALVPQTASSITKTLKKNKHALESNGLRLTLPEGRTNTRWIQLEKVNQEECSAEKPSINVIEG